MYQLCKLAISDNFTPSTKIEAISISVTHSIYALEIFRHSDKAGIYVTSKLSMLKITHFKIHVSKILNFSLIVSENMFFFCYRLISGCLGNRVEYPFSKLFYACIFGCFFCLSCNTTSYNVGSSMDLSNASLLRYSYVREISDESVYSTQGKIRSITLCANDGSYWILTIKAKEIFPFEISQIALHKQVSVLNKAHRETLEKSSEVRFVELSPTQIKVRDFNGEYFVYSLAGIPGIPFCGKLKGLGIRNDNTYKE